ncbi:MAG: orotate phosphoribosyltransferase [Armatimonadetes bacterium]|nr:orotate phosphoribosyltransferase [Armatimonadota bacterium]
MSGRSAAEIVADSQLIRHGHFVLSSGMHTPYYVAWERVLQHPVLTSTVCQALADRFRGTPVDVVISSGVLGAILGHETARALGAQAVFVEGMHGRRVLRPGFRVESGARALLVEEVIVTGESARELMRLVSGHGSRTVGVAALVDRSSTALNLGVPVETLAVLDLEAYPPPMCPQCREGVPLERPGQ